MTFSPLFMSFYLEIYPKVAPYFISYYIIDFIKFQFNMLKVGLGLQIVRIEMKLGQMCVLYQY